MSEEAVQLALESFRQVVAAHAPTLFRGASTAAIARAPGRLDVMGGVADYSGSLVMELPVGPGAFAAAAQIPEPAIRVKTLVEKEAGLQPEVELPLAEATAASDSDLDRVHQRLTADRTRAWAALVAGCVPVLMAAGKTRPRGGLAVLVDSAVPIAEGVASSAAVEVASMAAICGCLGISLSPTELAALCQRVENRVAGAPCGIMDQMTAAMGRGDAMLKLRCTPADVQGHADVPPGVHLFGINSGVKHSVAGQRYGQCRVGAFMSAGILAAAGHRPEDGSLCSLEMRTYRQLRRLLPQSLWGADYLSMGIPYPDSATSIDPVQLYRPRQSADHAVYENDRVERFCRLLETGDEGSLRKAGQLMYASHWSYGAKARLGSRQTDVMVRLLRSLDKQAGVLGAKITGGGCGGTVAVMALRPAEEVFQMVRDAYGEATGLRPALISGTSPGASEFGTHEAAL